MGGMGRVDQPCELSIRWQYPVPISGRQGLTNTNLTIADEISQQMSLDVAMVLSQMIFVLDNKETYKQFLACRGALAQQLLDLVQDLLDFFCDSVSRPLLSTALLRLSRVSGLHPTCFSISGLEKVGHQVAGGGFGDVWKSVVDGQTVAVKSMRIFQDVDVKTALKEFGREAVIWRQLSHPNLLPFFGLYYLDTKLCLVSPWMEHGHLLQFLRNAPSTIDRVSVDSLCSPQILDVAMGLEYLHRNKVVHGDLKATNILVTPSNRACIADFGLSAISDVLPLLFTHSTPTPRPGGGTVRYQAPELLSGKNSIHFGSDVYAFACVCYEILTGTVPFFDLAQEMAVAINVIDGHRPSRPETVSWDNLWVLIEDCWKQEPDQRPTMAEILQRLTSPPIGAESMHSGIDWDETYSARFRRSVRPWPLLPSITQIKNRISTNRVISSSGRYFHSTEQMESNDRTTSFLAFPPKIRHMLETLPGSRLRCILEKYSLKFAGAKTLPVPVSTRSNSLKKRLVIVVISFATISFCLSVIIGGVVGGLAVLAIGGTIFAIGGAFLLIRKRNRQHALAGRRGTPPYITRPLIHGRSISDISGKSILIPQSMSVAPSPRPGTIYTTGTAHTHTGHSLTYGSEYSVPGRVMSPPPAIQIVRREEVIEPFTLRLTSPLPFLARKTSQTAMRTETPQHISPQFF
ncbi:kinase-like domain-containing protein [Mycena epipterygia]|nr:kinase-like domain-containing protein [Mycena epipterygia]